MKIVALTGSFDGELHKGHLNLLKYAATLGKVIVHLVCDEHIRNVKKREPLVYQTDRALNIFNTGYVDLVCLQEPDEMLNIDLIVQLKPDIYVFGGSQGTTERVDWNSKLEYRLLENKVEIVRCERTPDVSTTQLYFKDKS